MKFVLVSDKGVLMRRDVLKELVRRTVERFPGPELRGELTAAMSAALAEWEAELDTYAASVKG